MTWIQDAHRDWHTVNGKYAICPLDCGAGEAEAEREHWENDPEYLRHVSPLSGKYDGPSQLQIEAVELAEDWDDIPF